MTRRRIPLYTFHQRAWHWVQALTILALLLSGAEIHAPESVRVFGFADAVRVHNAFAVLLLLNAGMGLFYFVTSGLIRQFGPRPRDFFTLSVAQIRFYTRGIFRGDPHPMQHDAAHRLNPLQQIAYLVILNLLMPLQIVSGVLIWGAARWPELVESVGGLGVLVPLHALGAWFFLAFTVMHVYLTTTGETVGASLKSMLTGTLEVREEQPAREEASR
jgi:thiosulfate reductase cytochrome b subunit